MSKHTPGPWTLETVPTSIGTCHKIGQFPSLGARKDNYGSSSQNKADSIAHGTFALGPRHGNSKLDAWKVQEALRMLASGSSQRQVARRFGVHQTAISQVVCGRTWRHAALRQHAATLKERKEKDDE